MSYRTGSSSSLTANLTMGAISLAGAPGAILLLAEIAVLRLALSQVLQRFRMALRLPQR